MRVESYQLNVGIRFLQTLVTCNSELESSFSLTPNFSWVYTQLQLGVGDSAVGRNRFNGFAASWKWRNC